MAGKLLLPTPNVAGMSCIYNVSKHVGSQNASPNDADDVQLVQVLLREVLKTFPKVRSDLARPTPSGLFDTATAFWIFKIQADGLDGGRRPGAEIDGVVSPARGLLYSAQCPWIIARLNFMLNASAPKVWRELPNNPELRQSLRNSLR